MVNRSNDVEARVRQLLQRNPELSNRALARTLRGEGLKFGNTFIRLLSNTVRIQLDQNTQSSLTAVVRAGQGFGSSDTARAFQRVSEAIGVSITQSAEIATDASHIALLASATANITVTLYGEVLFQGDWEQNIGRFVVPNNPHAFSALVEGGIASRMEGEIIRTFFAGSDSFVEGVDIQIHSINVEYRDLELR